MEISSLHLSNQQLILLKLYIINEDKLNLQFLDDLITDLNSALKLERGLSDQLKIAQNCSMTIQSCLSGKLSREITLDETQTFLANPKQTLLMEEIYGKYNSAYETLIQKIDNKLTIIKSIRISFIQHFPEAITSPRSIKEELSESSGLSESKGPTFSLKKSGSRKRLAAFCRPGFSNNIKKDK